VDNEVTKCVDYTCKTRSTAGNTKIVETASFLEHFGRESKYRGGCSTPTFHVLTETWSFEAVDRAMLPLLLPSRNCCSSIILPRAC
jgi:hypothetical protein